MYCRSNINFFLLIILSVFTNNVFHAKDFKIVDDLYHIGKYQEGLKILGLPLERRAVTDPDDVLTLASIDEWAIKRQVNRRFRENRGAIFSRMNEQFEQIRLLARG